MSKAYIQDVLVRKRLFWIEEAKRLGVRPACLKLGIHRSHYYYWKRRLDQFGIEGLSNRSKKPKNSPRLSKTEVIERVLLLREETQRGADTLALLYQQRYGNKLSRSTIGHILKREGKIEGRKRKPKKKHPLRYQASKPGDRIQVDVKYVPYRIKEGTLKRAYQYTAIDDCSRARFVQIYDGHGIYQLEEFLKAMLCFFPFKIRLIQTDNHIIFTYKYTAHKRAFRKKPKEHFLEKFCRQRNIKHHLIEPGEPALNGKVERSHRTDQAYFYDYHFFKNLKPLQEKFHLWLDYYNHQRPHWGINGLTPTQKLKQFNFNLGRISHENQNYTLAA